MRLGLERTTKTMGYGDFPRGLAADRVRPDVSRNTNVASKLEDAMRLVPPVTDEMMRTAFASEEVPDCP